ncbi:MAG: OsmC family protein [Blastocatellia bacterium]|nr:OsmC family protein [Blastocatellia bacterium]MCS7156781.1 OsmC family protein [Blastocatellia bacterium]MCX7752739.1 OsmC family protein [Blastocatellia bacterium]MDW8167471.1 OsmC family protein [Acidobacteriota bacterium]MDW8256818.1 OsmC family protein [Acidobacteriota bacterium]
MQEVRVVLADERLFVGHSPSGRAIVIDADRERDSAPGPMQLLLLALGACTGTDVATILKKKRQVVTHYEVRVSAEQREEYPRIWQDIVVRHIVRGRQISEGAVREAIRLSETKYCSVSAMLGAATTVTMTYEIQEEEVAS